MCAATRVTRAVRWAAVAVTTAGALAACGGGGGYGGGAAGAADGLIRASWGQPQNPLEPANTNEVQGIKVLDMVFRGLKKYDPSTGRAEDAMAESIETEDQRTFTIEVKKGWTFSDGSPVTAQSYVDAWNYGALLGNRQVNAYFFQFIEGYDRVHPADEGAKPAARKLSGLEMVDSHTFRVTLNQKFSLWPQTLGYNAYVPLPRSFFENHAAWLKKPVGNGPYKIDSYVPGQQMRLVANEGYAGADKPRNKGVELRVYTDSNTAWTDLQAGNLDVADDVPAAYLKTARKDLGDRYINQPAGILQTVSFPFYDSRWKGDDMLKVRQGLSMAINREQITKKIYHGTRTPAGDLTSPVLGREGGYRKGLCGDVCTYDPERARRLIEEGGGLPGGSVTLTSNVDTGSHRQWMEAVCNSINNVLDDSGACTVRPVSTYAKYREQVAAKKMRGIFRTGWQMDYPLIQNFLQPLYYTDASSNDSGYHSRKFDELVDRANATADSKRAVETFVEAERIVLGDLVAIPLWYQNGTAGHSERVHHVRLNPFSVPVFTEIEVR